MTSERRILHVDMDAFFASIEQLDRPELRGRPVLVGGDGPRGVVAAASYEARPFGCRSAQPMAVARRWCPQAVVVPARGGRYREVSRRLFRLLERFTPLVEPLSIDEAFLDVTGCQRLLGPAPDIARQIKNIIREQTGLTASVGVAPNKFLAKLASAMDKPDGLTIIRTDDLPACLAPLTIDRMWGVGPKMQQRLARFGIQTFGDVQRFDQQTLHAHLGSFAQHLIDLAHGRDDRPVVTRSERKSISHEHTFSEDLTNPDEVRRVLFKQAEKVARQLRRRQLLASTVTVKIRYGDFETITRSQSRKEPTARTDIVQSTARELFDRWARRSFQPVRLIGVGVSQLREAQTHPGLFVDPEQEQLARLDEVTDIIHGRFGDNAIRRGAM